LRLAVPLAVRHFCATMLTQLHAARSGMCIYMYVYMYMYMYMYMYICICLCICICICML
jgi:hypothetical protein